MKRASLIAVGNELLSGLTIDTNSAFLGGQLQRLGLDVVSRYTVPDELTAIERALTLASQDADVVLLTGGLGPTDDDVSRQGMAQYLGVELKFQEHLLEPIRRLFEARGLDMPARNRVQACLPEGTEALPNECGTAPGVMARRGDAYFFLMPGVPKEMKRMYSSAVEPVLRPWVGSQSIEHRRLKCFGPGESALVEKLGDRMQRGRNPLINCTVTLGVITLHIIGQGRSEAAARELVEEAESHVRALLGRWVYGTGEQTLAEVVGGELRRLGQTLAVAESCTGGLLGKEVTDVPGASTFFHRGWITYSNQAKSEELGVPADVIARHGAVSAEVAEAMATAARRKSKSDYSIAITGVAGPDGGTDSKPVGLVFIAVDSAAGCQVKRCCFAGDRQSIRQRAAQTALHTLWQKLHFDLPQ